MNTTNSFDKRVQRTRAALLQAMTRELMERGYERLTVQNLLDRAVVGRATFYAHFQSKDELLAANIEHLRQWLVGAARDNHERLGFTLPLLQHLRDHKRMYQMLVGRESEVTVARLIQEMLAGLVRQALLEEGLGRRDEQRLELATRYVVSTLWSTIAWWMDDGARLAPREVDTLFRRLTFPGLDGVL